MGKGSRRKPGPRGKPRSPIRITRVVGDVYEFVQPRSVRQRQLDLEEAIRAKEAGEPELAVDELRWLLGGCSYFMAAHVMLADLAKEQNRWDLARAHYGYAFELGLMAIPHGFRGRLAPQRPANRDFFAAGEGLIECLKRLGEQGQADEVVARLRDLRSDGNQR